MFDSLKTFTDRLLGRGSAAITVPVMDGTLRPNRVLDDADVVAELPGIDDLAGDGQAHAVVLANEELRAEMLLELLHRDGERRLGDAERLGRRRHRPAVRDRREVPQVTKIHRPIGP